MDVRNTGEQKRFVCFSTHYLPNLGGVEFFTKNLCDELARQGFEVLIVCEDPADETSNDYHECESGGSVRVLRLDSWGWRRVPFVRWSAHTRRCLDDIKQNPPDYALINTRFYGLSQLAARLMNQMGIRPVLLDHGTDYVRLPNPVITQLIAAAEHLRTALLKRYQIDFYGVSKGSSRWLSHFGISSCGQINNAIDADAFVAQSSGRDFRGECGLGPDCLCVVFAGRLLEEKGVGLIVQAARELVDDPSIHFFIAGSGPMEPDIAAAAAELGNLTFTGRLDHGDLSALLVTSDVFCLPTSYGEGLPTSLLEAAACSEALMSTACGGVDEIIPSPEYGIVLTTPDVQEIVRDLHDLASDAQRLADLKNAAATHVRKRFSWVHTAQQAITAFEHTQRTA